MRCPTKNAEWKRVVEEFGEIQAYKAFFLNEMEDFTYEEALTLLGKGNIKPGVSELFESNPELDNIGTQEQYSQYLDSITSQPIVYKGLRNKSGKVHNTPNHSFFSDSKTLADKWYSDDKGVKTFVLKSQSVEEYKSETDISTSAVRKNEENFINNSSSDLVILDTLDIGGQQLQYVLNKNIEVLELGSEADINGFKEFLSKESEDTTDFTTELARKMASGEIEMIDEDSGRPCAELGAKLGGFKPGSKWTIVKDLKGHPSHAQGGVDVSIGPDGVSFTGRSGQIKAANGLLLPNSNTDPITGNSVARTLLLRNQHLDMVDKMKYPEKYPIMYDDKGKPSTHLMQTGEDDSEQEWMFPSIFNEKDEAIAVPNQYAKYISSRGYKEVIKDLPK